MLRNYRRFQTSYSNNMFLSEFLNELYNQRAIKLGNYIIQTQKTSKNSSTKFIVLHILVKTCQVLVQTARKYQFWLSLFFLLNFQTFIFLEFVKAPRKIHISIYYPFYFLSKLVGSRTLYVSRKINK